MTNTSSQQTLSDVLGKLVGRKLSSVTFVADYVQLAFNGPGFSAYTTPTVTCGSQSLSMGDPGYRDALCKQIDCIVDSTGVDKERVSIAFEGGAVVSISLRDADYRGPEALEFSLDEGDRIWVV
jgi:hypothetical protein